MECMSMIRTFGLFLLGFGASAFVFSLIWRVNHTPLNLLPLPEAQHETPAPAPQTEELDDSRLPTTTPETPTATTTGALE